METFEITRFVLGGPSVAPHTNSVPANWFCITKNLVMTTQ